MGGNIPEFLGRPNLPNGLAQSLVQLAASQQDPIAEAFKQVGKLADDYTARANQAELLRKKSELDDQNATKAHDRDMEKLKSSQEADLYKTLLSHGTFVDRLMPAKKSPMDISLSDLGGKSSAPMSKEGSQTERMSKEQPGVRTDSGMTKNPNGISASDLGLSKMGDKNYVSDKSKETKELSLKMTQQLGLPEEMAGQNLTNAEILSAVRNQKIASRGGSGGASGAPRYRDSMIQARLQATEMGVSDPELISEMADSFHEDAMRSFLKPGSQGKDKMTEQTKKMEAEAKAKEEAKKNSLPNRIMRKAGEVASSVVKLGSEATGGSSDGPVNAIKAPQKGTVKREWKPGSEKRVNEIIALVKSGNMKKADGEKELATLVK